MVWLILAAVLVGLGFLPLGFRGVYRDSDPGVWLLIGPLKFRVYPGKNKEKQQDAKSDNQKKTTSKGGSYRDFLPVTRAVFDFLGQFRRKIRINDLELRLTLAGDDPADLAVNYGRAWIALGNLLPQLERLFVIKNRNLDVTCDFTADKTMMYARVDATITLARTIHLLSMHGIKILKELFELKKLRKGGAQL